MFVKTEFPSAMREKQLFISFLKLKRTKRNKALLAGFDQSTTNWRFSSFVTPLTCSGRSDSEKGAKEWREGKLRWVCKQKRGDWGEVAWDPRPPPQSSHVFLARSCAGFNRLPIIMTNSIVLRMILTFTLLASCCDGCGIALKIRYLAHIPSLSILALWY